MEIFEYLKTQGMSDDVITKMWKMFSGCQLYIPKFTENTDIARRNTEIKRLYDSGVPVQKIARMFDLSSQQIYKVLK